MLSKHGLCYKRNFKLQFVRRYFENIKNEKNEIAKYYYSRIGEIVNQLRSYGENIFKKKVVENIFISYTKKYYLIITFIKETKVKES